ncbi:hypothetical protein D3C85_15420 [compost metagenome]
MNWALPAYEGMITGDQFGNFDTREIGRRLYRMLDDFYCDDEVFGRIIIEKDFETNYASLDALRNVVMFPVYALLVDYGDKSATVHDRLYSARPVRMGDGTTRIFTRKEADDVFYRALRSEGIANWRAAMFYTGVRFGGESSFHKEK